MIDIEKYLRDAMYAVCTINKEYECGKQENCDICISAQIAKHDAEVKAKAISEVEQKIYELQLKYENKYGCAITEMYVEIVADLLGWIRGEKE